MLTAAKMEVMPGEFSHVSVKHLIHGLAKMEPTSESDGFSGLFKMEGWPILIHNPYRKATTKGTPCVAAGKD